MLKTRVSNVFALIFSIYLGIIGALTIFTKEPMSEASFQGFVFLALANLILEWRNDG